MTSAILSEYLVRTINSRNARRNFIFTLFITVLFAIWSFFKGALLEYAIAIIPIALVNLFIIVYGCSQKASDFCILGLCIINLSAAVAQAVIGFENSFLIYAVAVAATVVVAYLIRVMNDKLILLISGLATLAIFAVCCVMPETNGARAWIKIGDNPVFQLTEVAKLGYVVFIGFLFSSRRYNNFVKFLLAAVVTGLSAIMLVARINEFGTLLVICSALYCTIMIVTEKKGWKILSTLAVLLVIGVLVISYFKAETYVGKWKCPECGTENHKVVECQKCDKDVRNLAHNFKCEICWYTTFGSAEGKTDAEMTSYTYCDKCKEDDYLRTTFGKIGKKVYDRSCAIYNYEYVKVIGDTYHVDRNLNSMKVGKLFGNKDAVVYIPNVDTDSIVAGLMNTMGMVFVLIILIAFYMVFIGAGKAKSPLRIMATFAVVFQALYTFGGTLNILPMTGIGMPLISRGGSNLLVNFILIYFMLSAVKPDADKGVQK